MTENVKRDGGAQDNSTNEVQVVEMRKAYANKQSFVSNMLTTFSRVH